jgi:hypothetical protein
MFALVILIPSITAQCLVRRCYRPAKVALTWSRLRLHYAGERHVRDFTRSRREKVANWAGKFKRGGRREIQIGALPAGQIPRSITPCGQGSFRFSFWTVGLRWPSGLYRRHNLRVGVVQSPARTPSTKAHHRLEKSRGCTRRTHFHCFVYLHVYIDT